MDRAEVEPDPKVVGLDKEEEEEDGETNALLTSTVANGCLAGKKRLSNGKRRVQWNDCSGDNLAEVMEFYPSDSSDSEDDLSHEISTWEKVISGCMSLCCLSKE